INDSTSATLSYDGSNPCIECSAVAFSPDGKSIITAGTTGTAQVRDVESGNVQLELNHQSAVEQALFSADGQLAVTVGHDGAARIWSAADGRLIRVVRGHGDLVTRAVVSNEGVLVTAALDGSVRISRDHTVRWLGWLEALRTVIMTWQAAGPASQHREP